VWPTRGRLTSFSGKRGCVDVTGNDDRSGSRATLVGSEVVACHWREFARKSFVKPLEGEGLSCSCAGFSPLDPRGGCYSAVMNKDDVMRHAIVYRSKDI